MRPIQKVTVSIKNSVTIMTPLRPGWSPNRGEEETEPRNRRRRSPSRLTEIYDAMIRVLPPLLPAGMTVSRIESSD